MKLENIKNMKGGWFIGDFVPSIFQSKDFEVAYKIHPKGEIWPTHYHEQATEVNLLIKGKLKVQDQILTDGDIFLFQPGEVSDSVFLEDCHIVVVKSPSVIDDKIEI